MKELENKIHDYIKNLYKRKFTGSLKVKKENGVYQLLIGIPVEDIPTSISLQTDSEEEFLKYVCDELKARNYLRTQYFTIKRVEHGLHKEGREINKKN